MGDADFFRQVTGDCSDGIADPPRRYLRRSTMTLQRLPPRKRTITTSHVKSRRPDSAVSSPIPEQVYSSSATGLVTPGRWHAGARGCGGVGMWGSSAVN